MKTYMCPKCNKPLSSVTETFFSCNFCAWMGMNTPEGDKLRADASGIDAKTRAEIGILALQQVRDKVKEQAEHFDKQWVAAASIDKKALYEGAASATVQIFDYIQAIIKHLQTEYLK